jgi:uncharacterized protein involved in response to NO
MSTTAEQMRVYSGPAILSFGFRPFFLAGAAWAALAVALWLPVLAGRLVLPTALSPLEWHVHELVFGYVPAIVAGFLLTAVPNWTGRLPVVGTPLLALFLLWAAGRLAIMVSAVVGLVPAALIDLGFLFALVAVIAREIIAGRNLKNLRVLAGAGLLLAGNAVFHAEVLAGRSGGYGLRLGLAATVLLIMLIGGRIIPSFTRNWLSRLGPGRLPEPFGRFDMAVMAVSAVALVAWIAVPDWRITAAACLVAGLANGARLYRWAGWRTAAEPLVLILHVAYAFVPLGFLLIALAVVSPGTIAASGALHAWTVGAIALMTLAVMTRASLGHSGRPLVATLPIQLIYGAALLAALARLAAAFDLWRVGMLHLSATAWVLAFVGFVAVYWPLLTRPRS